MTLACSAIGTGCNRLRESASVSGLFDGYRLRGVVDGQLRASSHVVSHRRYPRLLGYSINRPTEAVEMNRTLSFRFAVIASAAPEIGIAPRQVSAMANACGTGDGRPRACGQRSNCPLVHGNRLARSAAGPHPCPYRRHVIGSCVSCSGTT